MTGNNTDTETADTIELLRVSEMYHRAGSRIYAHARKTFGLIQVVSGSAIYEFNGTAYPVREGDLFCIPQNLPFLLRPVHKNSFNTRQFGLMIYDPELHKRMSEIYAPLKVDPTLRSMLDYIFRFWNVHSQESRSLVGVYVRAILSQFFVDRLNYDESGSSYVLTDGCSPATRKVFGYVESNFHKPFSLQDMGRTLGYNKNYLCSVFSKDTGVSVLTYLNFQRIRQAIVHFFYWGTDLAEVRAQVGFDSASYFNTLFKSDVGLPPGAFRKACLSLSAEERTVINRSTRLLMSGPIPLDELFASMKQFGAVIADVLHRQPAQ
ncbi:MAG: helix-turn-helix transcriptional regulator [Clostridia bacterium]|nr:helix-turn-helix transcriptional regulator [Clostridia bacterium]